MTYTPNALSKPLGRRLLVLAPIALTSIWTLLSTWDSWSSCPDTPCIVLYMFMTPFLIALAAVGLTMGWLATSPDRTLRWVGRVIGLCAFALQVLWVLASR